MLKDPVGIAASIKRAIKKRMRKNTDSTITYGPWGATYRCSACKNVLTYGNLLSNGGVCPSCGAVSEGTNVDYEKGAGREVFKGGKCVDVEYNFKEVSK